MKQFLHLLSISIGLLSVASISNPARAVNLLNGGFEGPPLLPAGTSSFFDANEVSGWKTTATDQQIEIWTSGANGGPAAYEGNQFAELNANEAATLFQPVLGIPVGSFIGYEFAHRARVGTDVMRLIITDLGIDILPGGGDDTVLYTNTYTDTNAAWGFYSSGNVARALGEPIRFSYEAVSTGNGDNTFGNFLDAVAFGVGVGAVPVQVPAPLPIFGVGVAFSFSRRLRRRIRSASTPR